MQTSSQISVRRLNWAGVEIVRDQQRIVIDPMENAEPFEHLLGKPRHSLEPIPDFTGTTVTLITHLHRDHCDRRLLKRLDDRGGRLITHRSIAPELSSIGLTVEPADLRNTKIRGIAEALGRQHRDSAQAREMLGLSQRAR
ncbi:MAG: MBL fold metallo-hydrolase [Verrucomicrobia bacterium]|nr:MBL fold metallo-hydrolase [Verrucomicrobiota bacterium]MBV8481291.1 MBL fold metallo-hydrolase [Verrucomicrobiota bacterium]